jgi:PPOX class probable F420-dependent enzyme
MIPEGHQDLLESTALAHVVTIGPHSEPQSNPVWFDRDGEHVRFSQTKTREKYRNVHRDPRIALSIIDPEDPGRRRAHRGGPRPRLHKLCGGDMYQNYRPGSERVVVLVKPQHTIQIGG